MPPALPGRLRRRTLLGLSGLMAILLIGLAGCGSSAGSGDSAAGSSDTLTVLAASSLTETFQRLATTFEEQHPGVQVEFSFDSSATLAQQAAEGAPADVLATADEQTMQSAVTAGVTTADPTRFAENEMVLVAPKDNPAGIAGIGDLPGTDYVVCVETAPCGKVAAALLADNGVSADPASREVDVKSVLAKVVADEADAGLVYRTDQVAAGEEVTGFDIPGAGSQRNGYFAAPLEQAGNATLAQDWIDLLASGAGRGVLRDAGFVVG